MKHLNICTTLKSYDMLILSNLFLTAWECILLMFWLINSFSWNYTYDNAILLSKNIITQHENMLDRQKSCSYYPYI